MSRLLIALFVSAGLGLAGSAAAQTYAATSKVTPMSKDAYTQAKTNADAQYKIEKDACSTLSGNAKDICVAEAKGKVNVAKADAETAYQNTAKHRQNSRLARAQASYDVAKEKCDDFAGNAKDVCVKEAKAALVKGKANAKVDRVVAETNKDAAMKHHLKARPPGPRKFEVESQRPRHCSGKEQVAVAWLLTAETGSPFELRQKPVTLDVTDNFAYPERHDRQLSGQAEPRVRARDESQDIRRHWPQSRNEARSARRRNVNPRSGSARKPS